MICAVHVRKANSKHMHISGMMQYLHMGFWQQQSIDTVRFCTEQYYCYEIQTSAFNNSKVLHTNVEWIGLIIDWYSSSTSFRGLQGGNTRTFHCHSTARDHQSPALWLQPECHSVLLDLQWHACEDARGSWRDPWCPNQCGCGSWCVTTTICAGDHGGHSREQWNISVQSSQGLRLFLGKLRAIKDELDKVHTSDAVTTVRHCHK